MTCAVNETFVSYLYGSTRRTTVRIDELRFWLQTFKHELTHDDEIKIKNDDRRAKQW